MATATPTAEIELITPQKAEEMLASNENNRSVRRRRVKQYADMMKRDQWPFSGDPIRFDYNGKLIDGQHRLLALIETGKSMKALVVRGLAPEVFDVLDSGLARSPGDVIYLAGGQNGNVTAAAIRAVIVCEAGLNPNDSTVMSLVTRTDLRDFFTENEAVVMAAVRQAQHVYATVGGNASAIAAFHVLAHRAGYGTEAADFLEGIETGENLAGSDVRKLLRDWMMRKRSSDRVANLGTYIRAFNNFLSHTPQSKIQTFNPVSELWPEIAAKPRNRRKGR